MSPARYSSRTSCTSRSNISRESATARRFRASRAEPFVRAAQQFRFEQVRHGVVVRLADEQHVRAAERFDDFAAR